MKATANEATLHFSGKAVTAWGALALMHRMLTAIWISPVSTERLRLEEL